MLFLKVKKLKFKCSDFLGKLYNIQVKCQLVIVEPKSSIKTCPFETKNKGLM